MRRLGERLTKIERRRLKTKRWVNVIDNDELEAAGYYLVCSGALTSDERYSIAVLAITGGIPDPLPPGVLKVRRDELDAVLARMNARTLIVRAHDSYRLMCD